jgi:hypothetical protein
VLGQFARPLLQFGPHAEGICERSTLAWASTPSGKAANASAIPSVIGIRTGLVGMRSPVVVDVGLVINTTEAGSRISPRTSTEQRARIDPYGAQKSTGSPIHEWRDAVPANMRKIIRRLVSPAQIPQCRDTKRCRRVGCIGL